jgi:hypothetical protein
MKFIFTGLFVCSFFVSYSQAAIISIEGVVKDFEGNPVSVATIKVKRSRTGAWTLSNGTFRLDGVKLGDTLFFSRIAFNSAYFVVQKKYHILNFRLLRDTVHVFFENRNFSTFFAFGNTYRGYDPVIKPIEFFETALPAKMIEAIDKDRIFSKIEVSPSVVCNYPQLMDTLMHDINQLKPKFKPKNNGSIRVYFWVRANKTIEVSAVEAPVKQEVKAVFINRFESVKYIEPAIQNGVLTDVLCVADFTFMMGEDKSVTLKMMRY